MDTHSPPAVLVVGAGPVGLLTALELARRDVPVRVVEKRPTPSTFSRAAGIASRTLEIFDNIGVLDGALAAGLVARFSRVWADGREALAVPIDGLQGPFPFTLHLIQPDTERLLAERLA